jgi:DMSO reductase family type II enzyme chaperone
MAIRAIDRQYARANLYRFLSLAFAYPTQDLHAELAAGTEAACAAAELISGEVSGLTKSAAAAIRERDRAALASEYRGSFTFSASPDCPLNECAYSVKHVYQEVQELADIAGFYTAFGLEIAGERPDELAAELEFCGLLALKEAVALERGAKDQAAVCREGSRLFIHDHLGRWAENIGRRVEILNPDTSYAAFGRLVAAFARSEVRSLKVGAVEPYQEVPNPPAEIDADSCPAEEGLGTVADKLQDDFLGELTAVGPQAKGGS